MRRWLQRRRDDADWTVLHVLFAAHADDGLVGLGGYELGRRARLRPGRLYPALDRLESSGQITAWWGPGGYPRRRLYRLVDGEQS